ncbi:hypothetical protein E2493_02805 [Sphingomonas parva]|uniref:Uncharacterized protein n=1 Tax=Sphingomonas parva TaxID=2555898 RepID=A0A4Y8ZX52_9SPHN|nr:hypothetical protein [Sphingomonas parva]TFI59785.1 hypothetical protein E2493_02805 [Sphingomonas parva]
MSSDRPWIVLAAMGLVLLVMLGLIASMDPRLRNKAQDFLGYGGPHSDEEIGSRDLFHSGADIGGEKEGESYAAYDARRNRTATAGFEGFGCPNTCSEHEAGSRWAQAMRITSPDRCRGATWPLLEGCVAYVTKETIILP